MRTVPTRAVAEPSSTSTSADHSPNAFGVNTPPASSIFVEPDGAVTSAIVGVVINKSAGILCCSAKNALNASPSTSSTSVATVNTGTVPLSSNTLCVKSPSINVGVSLTAVTIMLTKFNVVVN